MAEADRPRSMYSQIARGGWLPQNPCRFAQRRVLFGPTTDEIRELGHLGMGTVLYLSFVRYFTVIFALLGLVVTPNTIYFGQGERYDALFSISGLAIRSSMANSGSFDWSPGCQHACHGRGFCARTCSKWNSMNGMKVCGTSTLEIGADAPVCVDYESMCHCMPNYSGSSCEVAESNILNMDNATEHGEIANIPGWCEPPYLVSDLAHGKVDENARNNATCRGHGFCRVRFYRTSTTGNGRAEATLADRIRGTVAEQPMFAFCQCDNGFFGDQCQFSDSQKVIQILTAAQADFVAYSYADTSAATGRLAGCSVGACPVQSLSVPGSSTRSTRCGQHGICIASPISASSGMVDGPMSAYRPLTAGVCFCEPGHSGEQCAGGKAPSSDVAAWNSIATALLLVGVLFVYRRRKSSEAEFDDTHITPGDFTVFVDNLPDLRLDSHLEQTHDTKSLYEHFEKIGPVHFIAPATKDTELLRLQGTRRVVSNRIRMMCEMDEYIRVKGDKEAKTNAMVNPLNGALSAASPPSQQSLSASGDGETSILSTTAERTTPQAAAATFRHCCCSCTSVDAVELDPSSIEIDYRPWREQVAKGAPRFERCELCTVVFLHVPVVSLLCCSKQTLVQFLSYIDWRISSQKRNLQTFEYSRAFVTFTYADLKWVAIKAFKQSAKMGAKKAKHQGKSPIGGIDSGRDGIDANQKTAASDRRLSVVTGADPDDIDLRFRGRDLVVQAAPEPEEVLWASLDTRISQQILRCVSSSLFACLLATALFFAALFITVQDRDGIVGLVVATLVLGLNYLAAYIFRFVSNYEGHYSTGSKSRSLFMKVFLTQVTITVAASLLAAFGPPVDARNGYRQDWFRQAGAFAMRIALAEAVVPPVLNYLQVLHRSMQLLGCMIGRSSAFIREQNSPPEYILAERCASLMRTVLVAAAFGPAMPPLYLVVAAGLLLRYYADRYCVENLFAVQKSGSQLIRVLELTMMASLTVNAIMSKILASTGEGRSTSADAVALVFLILVLWIALAYASWKTAKAKDCWCGTGFLCPGVRYPLMAVGQPGRLSVELCERVHQRLVEAALGNDWFVLYSDSPSADFDETGGRPYHELYKEHELRRAPYLLPERISIFRDALLEREEDELIPEKETGVQYKQRLMARRRAYEHMAQTVSGPNTSGGGSASHWAEGADSPGPLANVGLERSDGQGITGGSSDTSSRAFSKKLSPRLRQRREKKNRSKLQGTGVGIGGYQQMQMQMQTQLQWSPPVAAVPLANPPAMREGGAFSTETRSTVGIRIGARDQPQVATSGNGSTSVPVAKMALASADPDGWRKEVEATRLRLEKLGLSK